MKTCPGLRTLTFLAVLGLAGTVLATEEGPYPIWWSGELELEGLDQVDQRLRRDLWPDSTEGFTLFKGAPDNYVTVEGHSCESLSRLTEDGYSALSTNDRWALNHLLSECRAIVLLGRAKPASVSYLRDFVLNAGALDYLPALVNLYPSCEFICYAIAANERAIPFTKFETPLVVDVESDDEMTIWTTGWMVHLTVVARGDFTADGVDDMLLISSGGATEGSGKTAHLYLMTRDAPGAVLRVIGAERELCPDYSCHPLPPDIVFVRDTSPPPSPADIGGFVGSSQLGQAEAESPPYPVWWSQGYELESLDQVEARLRRSFWSGMDLGIGLTKGSYDDYVEAEAKTCVELEALTQAGYGLPEGRLHLTQMHHLLRCRVIARLGTARPADRSFLRNFTIDEASTREALVAFGLVERDGTEGATHQQVWDMVLADGLGKLLAVDLVRAASGEVDVWTERGRVRVRIEARGDFTGDGKEDLLVMVGARKSRYRPDLTDFCLVTRASADAPLSMIDVAPYSCRRLGRYGRPAYGDN